MAKAIIMCGGAGGAASDECTALKAHVLAGKTAVTQDSGDEPAAGTMPERGNWNGSVGMNGSIIIPEGHHAGSGKVTGPAVTQRGAWTGRLGINGRIAIPEGYHNGAGYVDQAIATQGALTLNPGTTAKTGAVSGKYMTGNVTVPAVSIPADVIKKGHTVWFPDGSSVTGTFEGYAINPRYYLLNGATFNHDMYRSSGVVIMPEGYIKGTGSQKIRTNIDIDLSHYNSVAIWAESIRDTTAYISLTLRDTTTSNYISLGRINLDWKAGKLCAWDLRKFLGPWQLDFTCVEFVMNSIYVE